LGEGEKQKREKSLVFYYDTLNFFLGTFTPITFSPSPPQNQSGFPAKKVKKRPSPLPLTGIKLKALRFATEAPSLC
jgi:hypothetical protein